MTNNLQPTTHNHHYSLTSPQIYRLIRERQRISYRTTESRHNNRLEKVLSVFDQTNKDKNNGQFVVLDEANYQDDNDMQHILFRLAMATSNMQIRQDMNAEDVYIQPLEDLDTAIMIRDKMIKEKDEQLSQIDARLNRVRGEPAQRAGDRGTGCPGEKVHGPALGGAVRPDPLHHHLRRLR